MLTRAKLVGSFAHLSDRSHSGIFIANVIVFFGGVIMVQFQHVVAFFMDVLSSSVARQRVFPAQ